MTSKAHAAADKDEPTGAVSAHEPPALPPHPPPARVTGPLRILVGLEGLKLGGCPINALDLARSLRERDHAVAVFAIDEPVTMSLVPYAERCGFSVAVLPRRAGLLARAWQIHRLAAAHDVQIVHVYAPWLGPAATLAAGTVGGRAAVVTNWTMANDVDSPARTPLVVGTRGLQVEAAAAHESPVWLLEPPVDVAADRPDPEGAAAFRNEVGIAGHEVAVVVVSRLDRIMKAEGIALAMRALGQLRDPRLRLVVVGDGDARDDLERIAAEVNSSIGRTAIVFTGAMHNPRPAYAGADIVLGMGGSAIRALAHAKPVVVLGENGFAREFSPATSPYFNEHGFYGEDREERPVDHLAGLIARLSDPARRLRLGDFGRATVISRFALGPATDTLERIYADALLPSPSRGVGITTSAEVVLRWAAQQAAWRSRCAVRWARPRVPPRARAQVADVTGGREGSS